MTQLLLRLFVKNHQDTQSPAVREGYGKLAGLTGIVVNALLCAGKLLAGALSGSVSIMADAINNLSDAASSIVTLLGFKLAAKPADDAHPYGHQRVEYLAGLTVAALILLIGAELVKSSIQRILHPEAVAFTAVGAAVLLLWIPLRQMPGLGTISNVIVLGLAANATLALLPPLESLAARSLLLVGAVVMNALATGMYIGAGFGPGPRDGLMTGLHARTGWSLRGIRTAIEVSVLLIGWLLGGKVGVGTVVYAFAIGPLIQLFLPWFRQSAPIAAVEKNRELAS